MNFRTCLLSLCALICMIMAVPVYGMDVVMIPINYMEKQGVNFLPVEFGRDITRDIFVRIEKYYEVTIDESPLQNSQRGAAGFDAKRIAERNGVNDVLFGSIKRDGNILTAEIMAYNLQTDKQEALYAADAFNKYERLINTTIDRILAWYGTDLDKIDLLRNDVIDLREDLARVREDINAKKEREKKAKVEPEKEFGLKLPITAGYWSYFKKDWAALAQGTVEARAGVNMYPQLQFPSMEGMKNELSFGLHIGYRNGVTSTLEKTNVLMNAIIVTPMAGYHLNVYSSNWLCLGAGIFYECDFWSIEDLQYDKSRKYQQSLTGYSVLLEYSYRFNRLCDLNFGMNINGYFVSDTSPIIRIYFGTTFTLMGGRNEN